MNEKKLVLLCEIFLTPVWLVPYPVYVSSHNHIDVMQSPPVIVNLISK